MKYTLLALGLAVLAVVARADSARADFQVGELRLVEHQYRDGALSADGRVVTGTEITGNGPCSETQPCVYYDGPCLFDPDDWASGAATIGSPSRQCVLASWAQQLLVFGLSAKGKGTASITVRYEPWGWEHTWTWENATGRRNGSGPIGCVLTPMYAPVNRTPYPFEMIPPPAGVAYAVPGFAVPMDVIVSVGRSNPRMEVVGLWSTWWTNPPIDCLWTPVPPTEVSQTWTR